jgi:serine/threonine-protein kinase RIO1
LAGLWDQLVPALVALAGRASRTATLLAYNLLVHDGRLAIIAFPRVVDVIANPRGTFYLTRDAENMGRWFAARGLVGVRRALGPCRPAPPGSRVEILTCAGQVASTGM